MEKLIELLNEYEGQDTWSYDEEMGMPYYGWGDDCDYEAYLISKKYGFIKWLVENNKIDRKRKMIKQVWTGGTLDLMNFDRIQDIEYYSIEETLLMLLSISDSPIDDLISYIK